MAAVDAVRCARSSSGADVEIVGVLAGVCLQMGMLIRNEIFTATERIISPKVSFDDRNARATRKQVKQRNKIIPLEA